MLDKTQRLQGKNGVIAIPHWSLLFYVHWDQQVDLAPSYSMMRLALGWGDDVGLALEERPVLPRGLDRIWEIAFLSFLAKAKRLLQPRVQPAHVSCPCPESWTSRHLHLAAGPGGKPRRPEPSPVLGIRRGSRIKYMALVPNPDLD